MYKKEKGSVYFPEAAGLQLAPSQAVRRWPWRLSPRPVPSREPRPAICWHKDRVCFDVWASDTAEYMEASSRGCCFLSLADCLSFFLFVLYSLYCVCVCVCVYAASCVYGHNAIGSIFDNIWCVHGVRLQDFDWSCQWFRQSRFCQEAFIQNRISSHYL